MRQDQEGLPEPSHCDDNFRVPPNSPQEHQARTSMEMLVGTMALIGGIITFLCW